MSDLARIERVLLPRRLADDVQRRLRAAGERGFEAFALWVGCLDRSLFTVTTAIVPEQTASRTPDGVCVRVNGDELHRINVWLHEKSVRLIAQIHTHPTDAYHSDTDDTYAIATTAGCLSIVIPNFARDDFQVDRCAVYRINSVGAWVPLSKEAARTLIVLVD